ncbi:MAG: hypothetical protein AAGC60_22915 [Acidobacteriota bacterium]
MPTTLPPRRPPEPDRGPAIDEASARGGGRSALHGVQGVILATTLLAMLAVVLLPIVRPDGGRTAPLTVVVAPPSLTRSGEVPAEHAARVAEAARDALLRHLVGRRLLLPRPVDGDGSAPPAELARAVGAEETLFLELRCSSVEACRGVLFRVRAVDGSRQWQKGKIVLPTDDLRAIDQVLGREVEIAFLRFPRHDQAPRLYAEADDYASYLDLRRRLRTGLPAVRLLPEARELVVGSPRFADGYQLIANLQRVTVNGAATDPHESETLVAAIENLERAHAIAPADPRPLESLAELYALLERPEAAETDARLKRLRSERRWLPRPE